MVDFFELEKRCKKIRQKKIFKIVVIIFFVIIAVSLICVNTLTPKKIDKNTSYPKAIAKIDKNTSYPKATAKIDKNISYPKAIAKIDKNTSYPKATAKIDKNISYPKAIAKIDKNTSHPKAIAKIDKNISRPIPILKIDIDFNNIPTTSSSIPPKKVIKKEQNKTIIKEKLSILQSEALTFTKALKLAQLYYNNGDYQNSIKWCKLASKIDNNDERIWKLYALNLEKIGQKDKAIKVLKTYLKYKNSIELKYLLQRLSQ